MPARRSRQRTGPSARRGSASTEHCWPMPCCGRAWWKAATSAVRTHRRCGALMILLRSRRSRRTLPGNRSQTAFAQRALIRVARTSMRLPVATCSNEQARPTFVGVRDDEETIVDRTRSHGVLGDVAHFGDKPAFLTRQSANTWRLLPRCDDRAPVSIPHERSAPPQACARPHGYSTGQLWLRMLQIHTTLGCLR